MMKVIRLSTADGRRTLARGKRDGESGIIATSAPCLRSVEGAQQASATFSSLSKPPNSSMWGSPLRLLPAWGTVGPWLSWLGWGILLQLPSWSWPGGTFWNKVSAQWSLGLMTKQAAREPFIQLSFLFRLLRPGARFWKSLLLDRNLLPPPRHGGYLATLWRGADGTCRLLISALWKGGSSSLW